MTVHLTDEFWTLLKDAATECHHLVDTAHEISQLKGTRDEIPRVCELAKQINEQLTTIKRKVEDAYFELRYIVEHIL